MFENKTIEGIHYSRFVASWAKVNGKIDYRFKNWLEELVINERHLTETEIKEIYDFGTNGKLELQTHAKLFLSQKES